MIKAHGRKFYVLTGVIIFAGLLLSTVIFVLLPRGKPILLLKTDALFEIVENGDIVCRLGDRFWSQLFKDMSVADKRYSHIGIARVSNGQITVIHAEGTTKPEKDYVKEETFDDFLKIARAVGIYRIKDIDGSQLSSAAMQYIGVPFDWQFDMNDESKIYCTELLHIILKRLMPELELNTIYIKELGKEIIPLEAISNTEHFSEIYFVNNDVVNR
jgi:hypothetical protein